MLLPGNQGKATWMYWESVPAMKLRQREISAAPLLVTLDNIYLDMTIWIIKTL